jgi:autotransporter-associated beta strand protein
LESTSIDLNVGRITQLDSVRWVGPAGGSWSNASHWAGGAIPDLDNVANIVIPVGTTSVYDSDQFGVTSAAINNQGTIRFNSANAFVLNNSVAGTGGLEQRGIGVLTLAGNNSFSGNLNIGQGSVVLAHHQALGQGDVVSNGGALGLSSSVVLPRLRVNGDITINTAMRTTGDQIYNGNLTFTTSGTITPGSDNAPDRLANFESNEGSIAFMGTVGAGLGAKNREQSLVVSASNGRVTFNDQVGFGVVDTNLTNFGTIGYQRYNNQNNTNPWAVDVLASSILLNANVTSSETQRYTGATLIGNNGRNGFTRYLVSLDPSITFDGSIDDTVKGQHNLILRAISTGPGQTPTIEVGDIGQTTALASLDILTGRQLASGSVAEINDDRTTFAGGIALTGSVKTVGNQTYTGRTIDIDSTLNTIALTTEKGTIDAITGLDPINPTVSNPITGLNNTRFERGPRAPGIGANLRANAQEQGVALTEKIVGRLPSEESEQFGSGMVRALKRAIEVSQQRSTPLDELNELKKLGDLSAEVEVGEFKEASMPINTSGSTVLSASCNEQGEKTDISEQCSTAN